MLDVTTFGVIADGVADDTTGMLAARDAYQTNSDFRGGKIILPKGRIMMSAPMPFTAYAAGVVHNMIVEGEGPQSTIIDFTRCSTGQKGVSFDAGGHFALRDFSVYGAKAEGIEVRGSALGSSDYALLAKMENLRIQECVGAGVKVTNAFMLGLDGVWSKSNANGFHLEGYHTTLTAERCWASQSSGSGWEMNGLTYSALTACGSDENEWGWSLHNLNAVKLTACGAESNRREGWLIRTSNALATGLVANVQDINGLVMESCFSIGNASSSPASYAQHVGISTANSRPVNITMIGNKSIRNGSSNPSLVLNGASGTITTKELMNKFDGSVVTAGSVTRT